MTALLAYPDLLRPAPFDVHRLSALLDSGWDRPALDRALRRHDARRVRRGVYALGLVPTDPDLLHLQDVAGALLTIGPDAVASHRSGATARELPLLGAPGSVDLTVPRRTHRAYDGLSVHVGEIGAADRALYRGLPTTSIGRTLVDVARTGGRRAGLVIADGALHPLLRDEAGTREVLADWDRALAQAHGWPGVVDARFAREHVDARAESALETLFRMVAKEIGLPELDLQVPVVAEGRRYRLDAVVRGTRVAIECEGRIKYRLAPLDGETSLEDRVWQVSQRDWRLFEVGWFVVHVTWDDVVRRPEVVRRRVFDAMTRSRGART